MRISRNAIQMAVAGAVVGAGLGLASTANAGITYDLRFADGTHTAAAAPGTYQLQLWAELTGTDTDHTNDSLIDSYVAIQSSHTGTGAIASGGGGLSTGTLGPAMSGSGARAGGATDINGDGVVDWGSSSTDLVNTNYMFVRTQSGTGGLTGGDNNFGGFATVGDATDANTWEFKLATFNVNITATGNGTTSFNVVQPTATVNGNGGEGNYLAGNIDNPNLNATNYNINTTSNLDAYANSHGVTFAVPEPASLSLLGLGALGLLGRRRKRTADSAE